MLLWTLAPEPKSVPFGGLWGHQAVDAVFSPDDRSILLATNEHIYRYDSDSLEQQQIIDAPVPQHGIERVAYSPDGKSIWVLSEASLTIVYSSDGKVLTGYPFYCRAISFSDNLVAAANGRSIRLFDTQTKKVSREIVHDTEINSVAFTPDGQYLYAGTWTMYGSATTAPGSIRLWNMKTGNDELVATGLTGSVELSLSDDGSLLAFASGSRCGIIETASLQILEELRSLSEVKAMALSASSSFLLLGGGKLWQEVEIGSDKIFGSLYFNIPSENLLLWKLDGITSPGVPNQGPSPTHNASAGLRSKIDEYRAAKLDQALKKGTFDPDSKTYRLKLTDIPMSPGVTALDSESVNHIAISPDGKYAFTSDAKVQTVAPDGNLLYASGGKPKFWTLSPEPVSQDFPVADATAAIQAVFSPDSETFAVLGAQDTKLFSVTDLHAVGPVFPTEKSPQSAAFFKNSLWIATCDEVSTFNASTAKPGISFHTVRTSSPKIAIGNDTLAVSSGNQILVYDLFNPQFGPRREILPENGNRPFTYSSDGRFIYFVRSKFLDGSAKDQDDSKSDSPREVESSIVRVDEAGKETIIATDSLINDHLSLSADGTLLAYSTGPTCKVIRTDTFAVIAVMESLLPVTTIALAPDGTFALVGGGMNLAYAVDKDGKTIPHSGQSLPTVGPSGQQARSESEQRYVSLQTTSENLRLWRLDGASSDSRSSLQFIETVPAATAAYFKVMKAPQAEGQRQSNAEWINTYHKWLNSGRSDSAQLRGFLSQVQEFLFPRPKNSSGS